MNEFVVIPARDLEILIQRNVRSALKDHQYPTPPPEKPDLTDVHGAVEETGLSTSTIYQRGDRMPRIKTPKKVLYSRKALREWVLNGMPDVSKIDAANKLADNLRNNKNIIK